MDANPGRDCKVHVLRLEPYAIIHSVDVGEPIERLVRDPDPANLSATPAQFRNRNNLDVHL